MRGDGVLSVVPSPVCRVLGIVLEPAVMHLRRCSFSYLRVLTFVESWSLSLEQYKQYFYTLTLLYRQGYSLFQLRQPVVPDIQLP